MKLFDEGALVRMHQNLQIAEAAGESFIKAAICGVHFHKLRGISYPFLRLILCIQSFEMEFLFSLVLLTEFDMLPICPLKILVDKFIASISNVLVALFSALP